MIGPVSRPGQTALAVSVLLPPRPGMPVLLGLPVSVGYSHVLADAEGAGVVPAAI